MPRTEAANQRLREAQREKILEAANRVFARKGMDATMGDVATEAGISQGLAYHYFASKEALFQALIERVVQAGPAGLKRVLEMPGTPGERITLLVQRIAQVRRDSPEIYQLIDQVMASETASATLRERIQQQGQTFYYVLRQLVVEGQDSGEVVSGDPDQLVTAVVAYLLGLSRLALHDRENRLYAIPDANIILRMLLISRPAGSRA